MAHALFGFALLLAAISCVAVKGDQPGVDVPIAFHSYFRDLKTVQAVAGRDSLTLLFDTGGGATLITPTVAQRIGCRPHGRDVGHRMTGETVEFQRCDSITLDLSGWSRRVAPVAVFDVNALLPAELPRVDGVLALDAFSGQVLTIDWTGDRLIIHAPRTGETALTTAGLSIRPATGETGRMLTVFAQVAGARGPIWLLLDSGNLRGTLVDDHVFRDSLLVLGPDSLVSLDLGPGRAHRTSVSRGTFVIDGALGTDFLKRGPVALDLRGFGR